MFWLSYRWLCCSLVTLVIRVGGMVAPMSTLVWPTQGTVAAGMFVSWMKTR